MKMKTATPLRCVRHDTNIVQWLYELSTPLESPSLGEINTVVVSAVVLPPGGPVRSETYIFPATPQGEIADWGELPGSLADEFDHDAALSAADYAVLTYPD